MRWLQAVARLRTAREPGVLVTLTSVRGHAPREAGAKMVVGAERSWDTIGGGNLEAVAVERAREMIAEGSRVPESLTSSLSDKAPFQHGMQCCGGEVGVLLEPLTVVPVVAIFGMGHVGHELARILARHDLDLHLVDSRPEALGQEALAPLADADARVHVHPVPVLPELVLGELPPGTHVLVMTHDHAEDAAILDAALRTAAVGDIGLIGSRAKWLRLRSRLLTEGGFGEEDLVRVTTPIGLPGLVGKEPATIAVGVAADLLMRWGRSGAGAVTVGADAAGSADSRTPWPGPPARRGRRGAHQETRDEGRSVDPCTGFVQGWDLVWEREHDLGRAHPGHARPGADRAHHPGRDRAHRPFVRLRARRGGRGDGDAARRHLRRRRPGHCHRRGPRGCAWWGPPGLGAGGPPAHLAGAVPAGARCVGAALEPCTGRGRRAARGDAAGGGFAGMLAEATLETWGLLELDDELDDEMRDGVEAASGEGTDSDVDASSTTDDGARPHGGPALRARTDRRLPSTRRPGRDRRNRNPPGAAGRRDAGAAGPRPGAHASPGPRPRSASPTSPTRPTSCARPITTSPSRCPASLARRPRRGRCGARSGRPCGGCCAAGPVDVLHLRMADVGSWAAAQVAAELGIPIVLTLAPTRTR